MTSTSYITTPIYYVNDKPHIGHAYSTLAADVLARWRRMQGKDVFFLTGTDEHGQKVEKAAADAGMDPQAFTDQVSGTFRALAQDMGYSITDFIRTTEPRHKRACQVLWEKLAANGEIYLGHYEGWYAVRDEAFYGPDELTERDGVKYAPSGAPVEWVREPSYFFRLSAWQDRLLAFYEANPDFILPSSRRNEVIAFVKSGLGDLSISRTSFTWGVKVPGDEAHVMYVWLDALTNYITAAGYPDDPEAFAKWWPAELHIVGKDILRFHAIYWPAFLMAAGIAPPKRVFAHGWWTVEGQKISKSLGNAIDPRGLVEEFGLDAVRYFLLREVPFGQDGDFSRAALVNRLNGELANALGNLANRTLSLIQRNCGGKLPAPVLFAEPKPDQGVSGLAATWWQDDWEFLSEGGHGDVPANGHLPASEAWLVKQVAALLDEQKFDAALSLIFATIREANGYITRQQPWKLKKDGFDDRAEQVLRRLHDVLRTVATILQPFMPDTMAKLLAQLGVPEAARGLEHLAEPLPAGLALPPPEPLFKKVEAAA
ncbi:methionine--tRNA ligase [Falsiroseomonas stagni]|uniref:Methionine--tRNA ligase n=1 Tax=Falsiroseomonas stagni DSM 19981 TaxID=1123062 RepID=A0A1I4B098_9PROT|nr:methionine--tRNA ligase [Falsiroseomonas stagni]SFK61820.1 methionyl-tRNA synthetase [Falsiroseomonas stagni DSM 19981]